MPDLTGTILLKRYCIEELLGRGGMAEVYLATDLRRRVQVAVKVLREDLAEDPEFVRRFRHEAEALARLDHPNIVRLYEFVQQGATACVVMDYIKGITLRRRLMEAGGPLELEEISDILRQVSAALGYAHSEGIAHRDIKPGNIMLQEGGRVLLTDFGIAKVIETGTVTTMALGTPAYMSPEQIEGLAVDQRTDIYSLGVMLYEMATGRRPFNGERGNGVTTLEKIRDEQVRLRPTDPRLYNPELPQETARVILRALAKDREDRWDDVDALYEAWEKALFKKVGEDKGAVYDKPPLQAVSDIPNTNKRSHPGLLAMASVIFGGLILLIVVQSVRQITQHAQASASQTVNAVALASVTAARKPAAVKATETARPTAMKPSPTATVHPTAQPTATNPPPSTTGKITFTTARDGNYEIYIMNADGSGQRNLTNAAGEDEYLTWSPDGQRIAFETERDGNGEIYVMNADGSDLHRLTNNGAIDGDPSWSPQ